MQCICDAEMYIKQSRLIIKMAMNRDAHLAEVDVLSEKAHSLHHMLLHITKNSFYREQLYTPMNGLMN